MVRPTARPTRTGSKKLWWLATIRAGPRGHVAAALEAEAERQRRPRVDRRVVEAIPEVGKAVEGSGGGHQQSRPSGAVVGGPAAADLRLHAVHHFRETQAGAVQHHGVGRGLHRRQAAGRVATVALFQGTAAGRPVPPRRRARPARPVGAPHRSSGSADRKNLQNASGKTTVPWSRPSQTMRRPAATTRCIAPSRRRTTGLSATMPEPGPLPGYESCPKRPPSRRTRPGGISRRIASIKRVEGVLVAEIEAGAQARPASRRGTSAPVSRNSKPSRPRQRPGGRALARRRPARRW